MTTHAVGRRAVVSVEGEIDIATVSSLTGVIDAALAAGALELWIDLTPTSFMDSSGVHALIAADARTRGMNRRLAVIVPPGCVRRLFDVTGVSGLLPVYGDRAAAHLGS